MANGEKEILKRKVDNLVSETETLKKGIKVLEEEEKRLRSDLVAAKKLRLEDFSRKAIFIAALTHLLPTFSRILKRG